MKAFSQKDNHIAYDENKSREKECLEWLKSKKKDVSRLINAVALVGIFNGCLIIIQSALLAFIFHHLIIENQPWIELKIYFILLSLVFIFRSLSNYFAQTLGFKVAVKIKRTVREELLDKFSILGPVFVKQHHSGELSAATLEHTESLEKYFSRYLPQQIIVSILPIIMIAVVMPVNWIVAVIFLVTGPLIPVFMALIGMGAASAQRNQFLAMSRMSGYFLDRIQGLTTLKIFGQAEAELLKVSDISTSFREKTMEVLRIAFLSSAVLEFFSAVAVALVAVYVGLGLLGLVRFGPAIDITLQEALFVLLLAPEFFQPLKQLAVFYHDKAAALGATDHILTILQQPYFETNDDERINNSEFCIEFIEVSKSYQQKEVIKSLSLQIRTGEKIAIVGESGVGKTTLFNLLLGFESLTSGSILIKGKNVNQHVAAKNIAWAGQQAIIFYATIRENISLLNSGITQHQINIAADTAGVTEYSKEFENGLLTLVGENGYGLSGGQIQRIALARAFLKDAPIMLLDEPTAHLDEENKIKLLDKIESLFIDKTLIIASHDPLVIERMGRIIYL
ncbi:MAG: thiol reductant ABC exporter subunit CydD [Methylococcaceae bacterium]|nr:thiol reductant ABC exporter subunit CydD [Methylococcaceae bacterium]